MIRIIFYKTPDNSYAGFELKGHAGFAESGHDIVCSAVSILAINTINSVETFTDDKFKLLAKEKQGIIKFRFLSAPSSDSILLIRSMQLGMEGLKEEHSDYISVKIKEV